MSLPFLRASSLSAVLPAVVLACTGVGCSSSSSTDPTVTPDPSTADGGTDGGGLSGDGDPATQLVGSQGAWAWNRVEGSKCGNGVETGVGVNLGTSDRLVFYFEGGGACWNGLTCFAAKSATNIETGYGEAEFTQQVANRSEPDSIFDRSSSLNVFKDDTFVYIPYCTGDVHAGAKVSTYDAGTVHHFGRTNVELALKKASATWKGKVGRVVVSGSSAGGFGGAIHFGRIADAFAPTRTDLVDDSGPPFPAAKSPYLAQWDGAWDLFGAFPADCAGCKTDPAAAMPYYAQKYPTSRMALLSYDRDSTISRFYGMNAEEFKTNIEAVATDLAPLPNGRTFYVKGTAHTMLRKLGTTSSGTQLGAWLRSMITDGSDWANVKAEP